MSDTEQSVPAEFPEGSEVPNGEAPTEPVAADIECSICGKEGGPTLGCDLCQGNPRFVQTRAFSLTEERQGKNPTQNDRYGPTGDVSPKIVVLPGGYDPRAGKQG